MKSKKSKHIQPCLWCKRSCGFCRYSARLKEVPGWEAKKVTFKGNSGVTISKYIITDCPQFKLIDEPLRNARYPFKDASIIKSLKEQMCKKDKIKAELYGFSDFLNSKKIKSLLRQGKVAKKQ